ncbi:hypothetical protein [Modestobacter marinus]|uniref:hypothetical protein n=1 Tax=Modestobacter marinus TaxID=477641 RepID=UPI001C94EAED|nr:hypothetical protein [Modestobacter marinus]
MNYCRVTTSTSHVPAKHGAIGTPPQRAVPARRITCLVFGGTVADIVEACSDSLNETDAGKAPWADRKRDYIDGLRDKAKKSDEALLVTSADKIHNGSRIAADLRNYGSEFWSTFNAC